MRIAAALVVAMAALTACGLSNEQLKPTIAKDQATRQVKSYDAEIKTALPGKPQPSTKEPWSLECETTDIPGPKGRVELSTDTVVASGHPEGNPEIVEAFDNKLVGMGFDLDRRSGNDRVYKNKANGFTVGLKESGDDSRTLTLSVASPCVWPDGTPPSG
ncbi:hypothetical protein [Kitasatospora sp. HPMI-4]|uniref:hypothetical protein n=1 Tax=Kitasatospora sp. HPMI-4 TaxID=3448443 RepID=UPI003F19DE24